MRRNKNDKKKGTWFLVYEGKISEIK